MATFTNLYVITSTRQSIVSIDNVTQYVTLHSEGSTYVGNSAVTDDNGIHIANNETLQLVLPTGCDLWAVAASGSHDLRVLITRVD